MFSSRIFAKLGGYTIMPKRSATYLAKYKLAGVNMQKHHAKKPRNGKPTSKDNVIDKNANKSKAVSVPGKITVLPSPIKSENDKKEYRVIQLQNGLIACLISDVEKLIDPLMLQKLVTHSDTELSSEDDSDSLESGSDHEDVGPRKKAPPEEKLAGASLCIGVGSFSDPKSIQGMAHFLEHMVFMGSDKFPVENDFDAFLRKRGGSDNASTDCETTTFYLECQERHLSEALDKFSNFFISPLLKREAMTREREAIESEFQMAFSSDADRREQLMLTFIAPDHPANTFTWGNLITLRDNVDEDVLYKSLHEFRKRHYSAHRMCLAIQARLPMETLQSYVIDYFSKVPNNNQPPDDFKPFAKGVYDTPAFKRLYYVKPVKDICQLHITWAMPSLLHLYKCKPHQYIGWLLGHEGKGSLINYLKKNIWALNISAGNSETGIEHNSMFTIFSVTMVLTDDGFNNIPKVVSALFSYLNLLKKAGPQQRIFTEIQSIEETTFRFRPERTAGDYVEALSENMHFYPPEHYICGSELYFEYKPEAIVEVLEYLVPDSLNIIVTTSKLPDGVQYDKTEKWFQTKYTDTDIPIEWFEAWKSVEIYNEFALPEPNIYLTTNFSILTHTNVTDYPVKIYDTDLMELWYRADTKFNLPIAYMYYYFITPLSLATPQHAVMMDLYVTLLSLNLEEEAYPAEVAELNYSINPSEKGITLRVNGYNEKLPLLLDLILKYMQNFSENLQPVLFEAIKEKQMKYYYNNFIKPAKLVRDIRLSILTQQHWTAVDKHAAISQITFEMLKAFGQSLLQHVYIQGLVQGNITKDTALKTVSSINSYLKCGAMLPSTAPELRVRQLPLGEFSCTIPSFNKNDTNSTVTNYYQSGPCELKNMVMVEILMMIIEEPLFDILRTKEQLGYHVFCSLRDTFGILGYSITVNTQADKFTAEHVDERIEEFVKHAIKLLKKMPKSEFLEVKNDLIKLKQCADIHLKEEVQRNWSEITMQEFIFDRLHREVKCIKEITQEELIQWFEQHSICGSRENLRKLSIQVVGNSMHGKVGSGEILQVAKKTSEDNISKHTRLNSVSHISSSRLQTVHRSINYGAQVDYPLFPIDNRTKNIKKVNTNNCTIITDMEDFKNGLFIYPVYRLNVSA